ncbi:mitochondrial distribution and morphology protein 10 [Sphaerosporella brunnea]|uniref:Mitochondrial distribution and morphology protein 10 n=1 Tax=Sphaerosporella brunnea TaxID=1250544 RepID=A0A5J5ENV7_9PEZI|nr:mitochondrial distribution and morphology protein 10 [Sphaerosporella brunnea]
MLDFMDLIQTAFSTATHWDPDNSYSALNLSSTSLLDFPTPRGLRMHLSSLSTPHFATSYTLGSLNVIDGSLSYLYSSVPLALSPSSTLDLRLLSPGYRQLLPPSPPTAAETLHAATLLYGRMFLPRGTLEALYLRRLSPAHQLRATAVSDAKLRHGGTILFTLQHDTAKYSSEYLYSSDVSLLGWRGLYNFAAPSTGEALGRLSAGAELYYGVLNKSAGMSTGLRYATLPSHPGIPLTMTLTLNPLMGHLSATYAVKAGKSLSLASRFEFNMYSYESDIVMGCEMWRPRGQGAEGVLKARIGQNGAVGLLWEGRVKELLFSVGGLVDFRRREGPVKVLGVEVAYSS